MRKPVKKATRKSTTKAEKRSAKLDDGTLPAPVRKAVAKSKRPSSDPNIRIRQVMEEHEARVAASSPPWGEAATLPPVIPFAEQLSAHMKALGAKGGKIGGKRRLETMTVKERSDVAKKAAAARWAKRRPERS